MHEHFVSRTEKLPALRDCCLLGNWYERFCDRHVLLLANPFTSTCFVTNPANDV